ncbi:TPA: hypothetical protein AB5B17_002876 [Vibrio mimicus]|uniref:glycosyltransferase family 4 protein n=1 Tax=Vibrio mimicus TaxID=674 RepID=UPI0011DAEC9C|nr:glycosyltransferase family 4 protein [Vibrio mimicus]TXY10351.1 glycosyltransferase family 4 protein [Vibrio mimicus]BCN22355.1 hypothetical protein [Vibrio mimicus]BCN22514.1 hypothetical protein [Vibrio mimicus]
MKENNPLLFISYFYGVMGCCPAEWADDKIEALKQLDRKVILVSSLMCKKCETSGVKHYRVPSLSWYDVKIEVNHLRNVGMPIPYLKLMLTLPFILTIGLALDLLQKALTSGLGGGKWSWAVSSFACSLPLKLAYRCKETFTTGGPASAHFTGFLLKFLTGGRLICELQDPLTGKDIGRNKNSRSLLGKIEHLLAKYADKLVFVTKSAAKEAKKNNLRFADKITAIYPGSRRFKAEKHAESKSEAPLEIIHLGTLYTTRNLYTLIDAIDQLIDEGKIDENTIKIVNLGDIYGEMREHHLKRAYVSQLPIKPRQEAIKFASSKKISLLVQHADDRSQTTIPYKTYDYMNIGNPILGLTNSDELSDLLKSNGHLSVDIRDVDAIKEQICELVGDYQQFSAKAKEISIDINKQTAEMLN